MFHLRVLVGACFFCAVMALVCSVLHGPLPVFAAAEKDDLLDINTATVRPTQGAPWHWRCLLREDHQGAVVSVEGRTGLEKDPARATYEGIKYKIVAKQK